MGVRYGGPSDRLVLYERLLATSRVDLKGATMPYTSRNGHMFSFLDPSGTMALRLAADARVSFLDRYQTTIAEQHGRTMKEFVLVPGVLLEQTEELLGWFVQSQEWIGTLRPRKATVGTAGRLPRSSQ
jgi:hypothetical protein